MRVIKFTSNTLHRFEIRLGPGTRMRSFKNGSVCTSRVAVAAYVVPLIDSGVFKHSWHTAVDGSKKSKRGIGAILRMKIRGQEDLLKQLRIGVELSRRLK